jgi:type IV secretory pathway TraG/TraD family ATPase VirD4
MMTQTYAYLIEDSPILRHQELFHFGQIHIYSPWAVGQWLYHSPKRLQEIEISIAVVSGSIFFALCMAILRQTQDLSTRHSHGSSRWATSKEIRKLGL